MKILHYIPSIDRSSGGVGSYMQLLAKELGKIVELHVVTHQSDNELPIENCQLHYIERWHHPLRMKRQWMGLLRETRPDVVHVNCCWQPESAMVQRWSTKRGFKTVYSPHGMLEPWILQRHYWTKKVPALWLYQKAAIANSDVIHATAESERQNLLNLGYNPNVAVVPNGIDVKDIQLKYSWKRTRTILFLSRVHVKKGIEILIEAVSELKDSMTGYRVLIAGEGAENYITYLKSLAVQKGITNLIEFIGGVYGDEKWSLYQKADVFVLPTHSENFGIVVAEALASGTPVITTTGTPWEELNSNHCGWWIPCNVEDLKFALISAITLAEDKLEEMGRNGRRLVQERYSVEAIAGQMKALYEGVLGLGGQAGFRERTRNSDA